MAVTKKHVTLCQEGNKDVEYYPNIEGENIPNKAISENQLDDNLQEKLNRTYPDVYNKAETDALLDEKADADNVYTKTETDALLDDKADADNVYTKTETDALLLDKADKNNIPFENIKDSNGNARFIEGALSNVINNTDYARWSLSGTHLMIRHVFKLNANDSIANYSILSKVNLPEWIMNKIYGIGGDIPTWVSVKSVDKVSLINADITGSFRVLLDKGSTVLNIYNIQAVSTTIDVSITIQFDLLIDNA